MHSDRIFNVLDRLAHPSTTGTDLDATIAALRRLLHGEMVSDALRNTEHEVVAGLRQKLSAMSDSDRQNREQIIKLTIELAKLQAEVGQKPQAVTRDFYTYDEILQVMVAKFGKHHGIPAALCERNARLRLEGQAISQITASGFQQWRKSNRFPAYVVEQIKALSSDDLLCKQKWTEVDRRFLADLYNADPKRSNRSLAQACSAQFGRLITECAIRGELDRLRKRGEVSRYRRTTE